MGLPVLLHSKTTVDPNRARSRMRAMAAIRDFFSGRDYLEVETPLLAAALIPESAIEAFATDYRHPNGRDRRLYLLPSPELWMKRLLGAGYERIFQICKAFRNAESIGRLHNPEFTMLEWYTAGVDYLESIDATEALLRHLCAVFPDAPAAFRAPALKMTVRDAFLRYASGLDLEACGETRVLRKEAGRRGLSPGPTDSWEAVYNHVFVALVEPSLPTDRPVFLLDYPEQVACLARPTALGPWRQRWELYLAGMEVANCFSEETDPKRIASLFRAEKKAKEGAIVRVDIDEDFPSIFGEDYPRCSGVALGVDRLLMALFNVGHIEGVIFFPIADMLAVDSPTNEARKTL